MEVISERENEKVQIVELILQKEKDHQVTLAVEWSPLATGNITCIYIEIHDFTFGSDNIFHAFLYNYSKKKFDLLKKLDHDNYLFTVYGLQRIKHKHSIMQHYTVLASAGCHLRTLNHSDESRIVGKISLVKDSNYYSKETQSSSEVKIRRKRESLYEISGLQKERGLTTTIIIATEISEKITYILHNQSLEKTLQLPFALKPATDDSFFIHQGTPIGDSEEKSSLSSTFTNIESFTAYMTNSELKQLKAKAENYIGKSGKVCLNYFYRNKSHSYFKKIYRKHGGIMIPYIKDNNGDRASIINGNIDGLFFSAVVNKKSKPLPASYFGKRRLFVRSDILYQENMNVYFADFYCHYMSNHYVTLVVTKTGSDTDLFCRNNILPLNIHDNPFLNRVHHKEKNVVHVTLGVRVEVLYTEAIDLHDIKSKQDGFIFKDVEVLGRGSSKEEGIPKNPSCKICNLNL